MCFNIDNHLEFCLKAAETEAHSVSTCQWPPSDMQQAEAIGIVAAYCEGLQCPLVLTTDLPPSLHSAQDGRRVEPSQGRWGGLSKAPGP